jgi:heme a synthase
MTSVRSADGLHQRAVRQWLLAIAGLVFVMMLVGGATRLAVAAAVTIQACLGILTLIHAAPLALALAHQGMAMIVLVLAVIHAQRLAPMHAHARVGAPAARSSSRA